MIIQVVGVQKQVGIAICTPDKVDFVNFQQYREKKKKRKLWGKMNFKFLVKLSQSILKSVLLYIVQYLSSPGHLYVLFPFNWTKVPKCTSQ